MNITEQLRLWGVTQAAARAAEHAAAHAGEQQGGAARPDLELQARALRERARHLHGEIYALLGSKPGLCREAKSR